MKRFLNLKMWGYFLMMALCVSLTACSEDDEENENGGGGNGISGYWGKFLQITEKNGEQGTLDLTYDHQGRIVKATEKYWEDGEVEEYTTTYSYESDKIIEIDKEVGDDSWYYKITHYLNDKGLIISSKGEEYEDGVIEDDSYEKYYEYDDQNRLISRGRKGGYDYELNMPIIYWENISWEGENIVSIGESYYTYTMTYYTDKPDTRGVNGFNYGFTDGYGILYASGYFGKKSANLLKSDTSERETYSYTFEGDKVKTMTGSSDYGSYIVTFNY